MSRTHPQRLIARDRGYRRRRTIPTDRAPVGKWTAVPPSSVRTSPSEKAAGEGSGDLREQAAVPTAEERNLGADIKPRNTVRQYDLVNQDAVGRVALVIVADSGRAGTTDDGLFGAFERRRWRSGTDGCRSDDRTDRGLRSIVGPRNVWPAAGVCLSDPRPSSQRGTQAQREGAGTKPYGCLGVPR